MMARQVELPQTGGKIVHEGRVLRLVAVSAQQAKEWLDYTQLVAEEEQRAVNRPLDPRFTDRLAFNIRGDGLWDPFYGIIHLAEDGAVINGQHRLSAIVRSGITCLCLVATGMKRSAVLGLDGDTKARSFGQQITIGKGVTSGEAVAAVARALLRISKDVAFTPPWAELQATIESELLHVQWSIAATRTAAARPLANGPVRGALAWVHRFYPTQVEDFLAQALGVANCPGKSPAATFARAISASYITRATSSYDARLYVTLCALKLHLEGASNVGLIRISNVGVVWARSLKARSSPRESGMSQEAAVQAALQPRSR